ncbi:DNA recombination protein RmuC [uncultured Rikenella sp.]|uniref:DNA recombination protein RmuC n=1 Tax=uncultured Rikenella sp. TaxID=368003 RepID=UPI0025DA1EDF|nr:DNA recombination protein RmuC [uncultured Rikenella sp.]
MTVLLTILIVVAVAAAAALWAQLRSDRRLSRTTAGELAAARAELVAAQTLVSENATLRAEVSALGARAGEQQEALRAAVEENTALRDELSRSRAEVRIWSERFENQTTEREKLQQQFADHFRNLANDILEEKTRRFTDTNRKNIDELLKPLSENIEHFRQRIERDSTERKVLEAEIKRLHEMSNRVSQEANNLAAALRGNSKTQGDWGEMILETLLESSGLQKGIHFRVQEDFRTEEGDHVRPDVVLVLPDDKQMIIDSKVSLTAYANYVDVADDPDEGVRRAALSAHAASVRRHIDELAAKSYQKLTSGSPDFVIMFVPNEPAFLMALQCDAKLWDDAYRKKVILSSPTNLFAILKIVDDLWRRDNQDRYAMEIARQGGALYDKFVGFAENFLAVGDALGRTDKAYRAALGQLREGNGNLVRRAESLRKLGVKASKKMPQALVPLDDAVELPEPDRAAEKDNDSSAAE